MANAGAIGFVKTKRHVRVTNQCRLKHFFRRHWFVFGILGFVHISSRGNILAQKRACRVENARKVFNLAVLFALQPRFCAQNLIRG